MIGLKFTVTCTKCGGPLDHTAPGAVSPTATCCLATCRQCSCGFMIRVTCTPTGRLSNPEKDMRNARGRAVTRRRQEAESAI